jgi:peroxiredoxin
MTFDFNTLRQGLTAVAFVVTMGVLSPAMAAVTVGDKAPDFTLQASDGSSQSLSSFAGKIVVLEWFNAECPFVRKHYDSKNMQGLQKDMAAKDVVWLTVNSSAVGKQGHLNVETGTAMLEKEGAAPKFLLLDADGTVGKLYDAKTTPHMFVIDKDGKLAYAGAIDDKPSADKADIAGAKNYVTDAVTSLIAGTPVETTSTKAYGCGIKYPD